MLMHVDNYGGKRWQKIPFENSVIEEQLPK